MNPYERFLNNLQLLPYSFGRYVVEHELVTADVLCEHLGLNIQRQLYC